MFTSVQNRHVSDSWLFRYCGRAGGLIVMGSWLVAVVVETVRKGPPVLENYYQAVPLAVIFAGYAVGWRKEILGGLLAIVGTVAFLAQYVTMFGILPGTGAAWFAVPGVFYLIAHYMDDRHGEKLSS
jgi:hypothetical protein